MKKILSLLLCCSLLFAVATLPASAKAVPETPETRTVEYLPDGSYFVTELTRENSLLRSSQGGSKTSTYYNSNDVAIFAVTVHGSFTYSYGVSSSATSASCTVTTYSTSASFNSKDAWTSGKSAYGYGSVSYKGTNTGRTVSISRDSYGNLS